MKVLVLGGPRSGEWAELAATARSWVDLLSGSTHRISYISYAVQGPLVGSAAEMWRLPVAVHPALSGPMEKDAALLLLNELIAQMHMPAFMREHAEPVDIGEPVIDVPDTAEAIQKEQP